MQLRRGMQQRESCRGDWGALAVCWCWCRSLRAAMHMAAMHLHLHPHLVVRARLWRAVCVDGARQHQIELVTHLCV